MNTAIRLVQLLAGRSMGDDLSDRDWQQLLKVVDRALCTPLLTPMVCDLERAPAWLADAVAQRARSVALRRGRLVETYQAAAAALQADGIEFVLLKGFSHEVGFGIQPAMRVQQDIDILCQPADLSRANQAMLRAGFQIHGRAELSANHSRPLVKPHTWNWRGDYFDPEMPVAVELHHCLWNYDRYRISAPGIQEFWRRCEMLDAPVGNAPALAEVDRLGFAALHLLRHVLSDNVRLGQAYELSKMVQYRLTDDPFWDEWRRLHSLELRRLQTIAFCLAAKWFDQPLPVAVDETSRELRPQVQAWLRDFGYAPLLSLDAPNKAGLGLQVALIPRLHDRFVVMRRRLLPLRLPARSEAIGQSYSSHVMARARHHARSLDGSVWRALRPTSAAASTATDTSD
jgi:hypothetical protein